MFHLVQQFLWLHLHLLQVHHGDGDVGLVRWGELHLVLGCQPVQQQLQHIMHQDGGDQQAPVAAPGGGGGGGLLGDGLPAPPQVQPLDNMGSIGAVVAAIANVSAPMVSVLEGMAAKINILTLDNRFTKQENQQLVVAASMLVLVGAVMGVIGVRSCTVAVQKPAS